MKRTRTTTPSADSKRIRTTSSSQHGGINYSDLYRKVSTDIEAALSDQEWAKIVDYLNIIQVRSNLPLSPKSALNNDTIVASLSIEWVPPEDNSLIAEFINKIIKKAELQNKVNILEVAQRKTREFTYAELKHHFSHDEINKLTSALPPQDFLINTLDMDKKIGEGSHGSVFTVKQKQDHDRKSLNLVAKTSKSGKNENIINEILVLLSLRANGQHPHIVSLLGLHLGQDHSLSFLSELTAHKDLLELIINSTISAYNKIQITRQIASALLYIHNHPCLYLDLKPENVLIFFYNGSIHVKLTDFGIARLGKEFTLPKPRGSVEHMAPEILSQIFTTTIHFTDKADIFGFFSTIFSVLLQGPRSNIQTCDEAIPDKKNRYVHVLENFSRDLTKDITLVNAFTPEIPVLKVVLNATGKMNPAERPSIAELIGMMDLYDENTGVKKELLSNAPLPSTNTNSSTLRPN